MSLVFVDTAYLVAMARESDQWHEAAVRAHRALDAPSFVTTDEVLSEFLTALSAGGPQLRRRAVETVRDILASSDTEVVQQSRQTFLRALDRYANRTDKAYSLPDCVSMNVMESMEMTEVLTSDRNFEQEGFTILMKRDV